MALKDIKYSVGVQRMKRETRSPKIITHLQKNHTDLTAQTYPHSLYF